MKQETQCLKGDEHPPSVSFKNQERILLKSKGPFINWLQWAYSIFSVRLWCQLEKTTAEEWKGVSVKVWEWNKVCWKKTSDFNWLTGKVNYCLYFWAKGGVKLITDLLLNPWLSLYIHTNCFKSLFEQECTPQQAMAALYLLIAHLGKVTSAVTNQEPSYAECLNNTTTWYPTQMVVVMLRGVDEWMIQHMYCPERKSQEQGPSDEYMFSREINTLINNNKQTQCCFLCMIVLWDNERACFILSNKFTGLAVISHVTAQLPRRAKVCLGLGFNLMRQF